VHGPVPGVGYAAFVDPSGGSADSMTLAIAHADKDGRAVLDAVRERRPPFLHRARRCIAARRTTVDF